MGKNIDNDISKNLSGTATKVFIMLNNLPQMRLKLLQKKQLKKQQKQLVIKLAIKLLIELRKSQRLHNKNKSEKVTNEHDKEISKERYTSPEERQKIIDE